MSQELFEKYLQGRLSEPEMRELSAILGTREGAHAFAEFVREWSLIADVSRALVQPARAQRSGTSKIRIRAVPSAPSSNAVWWAAGIAAAILFAVGVFFSTRSVPGRAPAPGPVAGRPRPEPVPVPAPSETAAPRPSPRSEVEAPVPPPPRPDPAPAPRTPVEKPATEKPVAPEPAPKIEPAPPPPVGKPTVTVLASVENVRGGVTIVSAEGRRPAEPGQDLLSEQGLETGARTGFASLKFPDQTRIELGPEI